MRASTFTRRWWRIAAAAGLVGSLAAVPVSAASASPSAGVLQGVQITSPSSSGLAPGSIKHVWTIILENKSYDSNFTGLNQNSYLWKTLPAQGVLLKNYYGTGHFSQDNYISMASGQGPQQDTQSDCDKAYKDFGSTVDTTGDVNNGQAVSNAGPNAADGTNGCVYPASVPTMYNQYDANGTTWKGYAQDLATQPGREDLACGGVGAVGNNPTTNPTNEQANPKPPGITSYTGAQPNDQYVAKHFPFPWFHSLVDNPTDCNAAHIANFDDPANGLVHDLQANTVANFNWITPNNCSDAHDAVCQGNNLSGAFNADGTPNYTAGTQAYFPQTTAPTNYTGGLYASDLFLKYYIPLIERSQAFKDGGLIDVTFDEANPPFTYGGSFNNANAYQPTAADQPNAANALVSDAAGQNVNGQNQNTEPAGPNSPLGNYPNGTPFPGPGDNGFIDRTPAGARVDSASGKPGSTLITDSSVTAADQGRAVSDPTDGNTIPPGTFVANESNTGPILSPKNAAAGGKSTMGSFTLVDASGNPVQPTGPVTSVTMAAETASTDPLYDATTPTPGGGDTGSVLISPFIVPGTTTSTYYNHYSWLRTMEDLFNVSGGTSTTPIPGGAGTVSGGLDGQGHLGFAAQTGLRAFGPDVFNNPSGTTPDPVPTTPEAPMAVGLPAVGLLLVGGYLLIRNRRARRVTAG